MKKEEGKMHYLALKTAGAVLALGLLAPLPAMAQDKPAAPPSSSTSEATSSAPSSSSSSSNSDAAAPGVVPGSPPGALPPPGSPLNSSPATPKIVQEAVTGLQKTDPINLDDMVRAQDAINRLDLLLEIEKRQTELKKIRDERNKPTLSAGIPASALGLPKTPGAAAPAPVSSAPRPVTLPVTPPPAASPISNYILKRIMGSEGRYAAVLDDGGKTISVRPGETLPDGSKVKTVTLTSISIEKDKKSKTLTIPSDSYIVRGSEAVTQ
jgi:type IV pilus biogenesis protein PilP